MSEKNTKIVEVKPEDRSLATFGLTPQQLAEFDTDKLGALLQMHKEHQAEQARRDFITAFHKVQSGMTPVLKDSTGAHGSKYAKAESVKEMLDPLLKENGFAYSVVGRHADKPDHTLFVLVLRHVGGHTEEHTLEAPVDYGKGSAGSRTQVQGMGSTVTYCTRYLLCMVFGVLLADDNDGNAIRNAEAITEEQAERIWQLLNDTDTDAKKFTDHFKVGSVEDLPQGLFKKAVGLLNKKKKQ